MQSSKIASFPAMTPVSDIEGMGFKKEYYFLRFFFPPDFFT